VEAEAAAVRETERAKMSRTRAGVSLTALWPKRSSLLMGMRSSEARIRLPRGEGGGRLIRGIGLTDTFLLLILVFLLLLLWGGIYVIGFLVNYLTTYMDPCIQISGPFHLSYLLKAGFGLGLAAYLRNQAFTCSRSVIPMMYVEV
jgi:hypothetical protein